MDDYDYEDIKIMLYCRTHKCDDCGIYSICRENDDKETWGYFDKIKACEIIKNEEEK